MTDTFRVFTITLDYLATGEGRTLKFLALGARSEEDARKRALDNSMIDSYFLSGADVFDGLPPKDDSAKEFLLSSPMQEFLEKQITNLNCHLMINLEVHFNFS
jgi:hypothetical protein